ncbi:MAG: LLM class flavin-dependent oxidoreductase [Candidatus Rokubacteria bacterium]|nr:LLM class flavin-dependent oxidoreductase [Candidatus Rokubacteria bacterium]
MDISCAFPPVPDTPAHVVLAERLGYRRAWVYDTPALQLDVWATLARAAERTRRIGLGPGVLIPSLRHVLVNAAAIATLVDLAPGRVAVAIGSGFTGRLAMGQRPNPWTFVAQYVRQLKALLAGEIVEVDGAATQLLHGPGQAPARPIRVPIVIGTGGPKGEAVARELGDGIFTVVPVAGFQWAALLTFGTVLDPGESVDSERVMLAAGAGAGVVYHRAYDLPGAPGRPGMSALPAAEAFRAAMAAIPKRERHLHTHRGHLTYPNEIDRRVLTGDFIARSTFTGEAADLRERMTELAKRGATEIAYQQAGPDIPRELTAFAKMAGLGPAA